MNRRGFLGGLVGAGLALVGVKLPPTSKPKPIAQVYEAAADWKFGQVILHPKKVTCLIKVPNELIKTYHLDVQATVG